MSEILTEALSRLDMMRHDHGQTWDLSKNDEAAISAVLDSHAALRARVAELERVIEEKGPHHFNCKSEECRRHHGHRTKPPCPCDCWKASVKL